MTDEQIRYSIIKINWLLIEWKDYNIINWVLEWLSEEYTQPTQEELETAWNEIDKENKIEQYNREFDIAIEEYENTILFDNKKIPEQKK